MVKNPHANAGFDPWVGKIPWRRKWQPTRVFLPGNSRGQRSLAGYSMCVHTSCSVVSDSLRPRGLQPARLFCPWDSPVKNTGVVCCALLQGIFPTQGSNPCLLRCRQILYCLRRSLGKGIGYSTWGHKRAGHDLATK